MSSRPPRNSAPISRFARAFWTAFGSIALVAGLYFAAAEARLTLLFWIALAASAVIGLVVIAWRPVARAFARLREYPQLSSEAERLRVENAELEALAARSGPDRDEAYREGVAEGDERTQGAFLALFGDPPEIVDVTKVDMGLGPALLCRAPEVELLYGARFSVVTKNTDRLMGVVAVSSSPHDGHVVLKCAEPTVPQFWEDIEDRITTGRGAPQGVVLKRYQHWPSSYTIRHAEEAVQALRLWKSAERGDDDAPEARP